MPKPKVHLLPKPPLVCHPGTRTVARNPNQHALHLRWLTTEQFDQIRSAARKQQMTTVDFVLALVKRYLRGNSLDQPMAGLCNVCKRRMAVSPYASRRVKTEVKSEAKPETGTAPEATTCRHHLPRHPGCSTPSGGQNHGAWWPREECNDPDCAKRTQGWKLAEINAAKRQRLEESRSGSGAD